MGMYSVAERPVVDTGDEGGAKQAFRAECDINNIMKKYMKTGMVTHVAKNQGRFADVSEIGGYQDAIDRVRGTHKFFMGLSPEVRQEFDNDAAVFLDFITDPANVDDIRRLGLEAVLDPKPPEAASEAVEAVSGGDPPEVPLEEAVSS